MTETEGKDNKKHDYTQINMMENGNKRINRTMNSKNNRKGKGNETGRNHVDKRMLVVASHWCMTKPSQDVCPWDDTTVKTREGYNVATGMMNLAMHNCAHYCPMMANIECQKHLLVASVCNLFIMDVHWLWRVLLMWSMPLVMLVVTRPLSMTMP